MTSTPSTLSIAGIGEALFDVFPDGRRILGGAPLNFSVHAAQLGAGAGMGAALVSRVGADGPGSQVIEALGGFGVDARWVQWDTEHPTGEVRVSFGADGGPAYDIRESVAWDFLESPEPFRCDAICFGTLAQRSARSRRAIDEFVSGAGAAMRLFDINLRQAYFDAGLIRRGLELANAVKLNLEELAVISDLLGYRDGGDDRVWRMIEDFQLERVALTRGAMGTVVYTAARRVEGAPARFEFDPCADAVGAGDSAAAAFVVGTLAGWPLEVVAGYANRIGAYVASRAGGTPVIPASVREVG